MIALKPRAYGVPAGTRRAKLAAFGFTGSAMRPAFALLLLLLSTTAQAYIGPGAGIGFLGSLWAWLVGLVVVLGAILIWPLRWLLRRMRGRASTPKAPSE